MNVLDITLRQFLEFAQYALPAVLFWYFLFRFQNKRSLPRSVVRDTFFIGIFSVIPLFLYQYAYSNWLPTWGNQYLGSILQTTGFSTSVIQILIAFWAIGLFFVFVIAGFTIFYSLFTKESFSNTLSALISEPLNFGFTGIVLILILFLDLGLRTFTPFSIPPGIIGSTFILAILEEYSKHLIVRLFDDHKIKNVANAIEFSIVVALSFAFMENIIYFSNAQTASIQSVVIGRSIISVLGHVVFSALFGYYYGLSKFANQVQLMQSVETHEPTLPRWFYKLFHFRREASFKAQKIFEGLFFASLTHAVFNLCLNYNFFLGVIPILVGGGYLIYAMLSSDLVTKELSLVGTSAMPHADFEKLTWKVSVMKHLQEIKKNHPDRDDPGRKRISILKHMKAIKAEHPDLLHEEEPIPAAAEPAEGEKNIKAKRVFKAGKVLKKRLPSVPSRLRLHGILVGKQTKHPLLSTSPAATGKLSTPQPVKKKKKKKRLRQKSVLKPSLTPQADLLQAPDQLKHQRKMPPKTDESSGSPAN